MGFRRSPWVICTAIGGKPLEDDQFDYLDWAIITNGQGTRLLALIWEDALERRL